EDTVARAVSRLRRALGDSAQAPRFIETLPKRGYRLIETVEALAPENDIPSMQGTSRWRVAAAGGLLALGLLWVLWNFYGLEPDSAAGFDQQIARADDLYMRFTRADNEAAIGLYERVLAEQPDHSGAQAGLANALVQRVVRWPRSATVEGASSLGEALGRGLTRGPEAAAILARAEGMAERAVRQAPNDPDALKALAFTVSARGEFDRAAELYQQVLQLDADAWGAMANLGEIASLRGEPAAAIEYFEQAWSAMMRAYEYEPQRVGPWQAALGVVIGERYQELGQTADAELWYRRVLTLAPFEPEATSRLAQLLAAAGDIAKAKSLCDALTERVGAYPGCAEGG
ncbi:MAG: tetratricopeptide repeat protein, partial [Pseudomonadota bacterium]